jgi:1,4-dihydroxy-2-naphthoyl-CoA hydrolase
MTDRPVGMPAVGGEVVAEADCLDGVLGFELLELGSAHVVGRFPIQDRVRQRFGLVHGGAYAALAEMLATEATVNAVHPDAAMGISNDTSFLRGARGEWITARGRARHRGRTTWVWELDHTDGEGRLCAVSRVTIAVRPQRVGDP